MQPFSLVGRILKAKYFPHANFSETNLGASPFVWSIWSARRLLEMGLRWNIGTGQQVRVWEDKWIPGLDHGLLSTPKVGSIV